jgi:hypothetical protein
MRKPISPKIHGIIDYLSSLTLAAAPALLGFRSRKAANLARSLGAGYTGMSLGTAYPLGAVKKIPFPAHVATDAVLGLGFAAAPWLLGFADDARARNFFLAMAGISAVVVTLTQARPAPRG